MSDAAALNSTDPLSINESLKRTLMSGAAWFNPIGIVNKAVDIGTAIAPLADRVGDYLRNTNWDDVYKATQVAGDMLSPWKRDWGLLTGDPQTQDDYRTVVSKTAQVPTDLASAVTNLPVAANSISNLVTGNKGLWDWTQPFAEAADKVRAFGHGLGTEIAGEESGDAVLRGTPAQMAGNMLRNIIPAVTPVNVAAPEMVAQTLAKSGDAINTFAKYAGRTAEILSPLAVNPSPKIIVANAAANTVLTPLAEALVNGGQPQTPQQQAATDAMIQSDQGVKASGDHATRVVQAGLTGDPVLDGAASALLIGAALWGGLKTDAGKRIITGYAKDEKSFLSTATLAKTQWAEANTPLFKTMEQVLKNPRTVTPAQASDLIQQQRELTAMRHGASVATRMKEFERTGKFMDTNIQSVPMSDYVTKGQAAGLDTQLEASRVMHAQQEIELRQRALAKAVQGSPIGTPGYGYGTPTAHAQAMMPGSPINNPNLVDKFAHNLRSTSYTDLNNIVQQGMAKPEVASIVRDTRDLIDKGTEFMLQDKMYTPREIQEFKRNYPSYVPQQGQSGDFLQARNSLSNWHAATGEFIPRGIDDFEKLGNILDTVPIYMERIFRSSEGNKVQRDLITLLQREAAAGNPMAKRLFGRELRGSAAFGPDVDKNSIVPWRDMNGVYRQLEVNDAALAHTLNNISNPSAMQLAGGLVNVGKINSMGIGKLTERSMVGDISLLHGGFFPITGAGYNAVLGMALKGPKGVNTGFKTLPFIPAAAVENTLGTLADRASLALHNSVLTNGFLSNIFGPQTLEHGAQWLRDWYNRTAQATMAKHGLIGPSAGTSVDPARVYSTTQSVFQAPTFLGSEKLHTLVGAPLNLVSDIMHGISSAPGTAVWMANPNVDRTLLSGAVRNFAGDPGKSGAFRGPMGVGAAKLLNEFPFMNSGLIQPTTRLLESLRTVEGATNFLTKTLMLVALPSAMATLWNASQGPEYIRHQLWDRTPDQVGSTIYVARAGRPPTEGIELSGIDPLTSFMHVAAQYVTAMHLGLHDGSYFKNEGDDYKKALAAELNHRFATEMPWAWFKRSVLPPVPPLANVAAATAGYNIAEWGDVRSHDVNKRGGFIDQSTSPDPMKQQFFEQHVPSQLQDILKSIFSSVGQMGYDFVNGISTDMRGDNWRRGNQTYTLGEALDRRKDEIGQNFADNFPGAGALFHTFRSRTPSQTAEAQFVKAKMDGLNGIAQGWNAAEGRSGEKTTIGSGRTGRIPYAGATPTRLTPNDPEFGLAQDIAAYHRQIGPILEQLTTANRERASIQQDNTITPYVKRARLEHWGYKISDLHDKLAQDLMRTENTLSRMYGVDVQFDQAKPGQPMFGFKPKLNMP